MRTAQQLRGAAQQLPVEKTFRRDSGVGGESSREGFARHPGDFRQLRDAHSGRAAGRDMVEYGCVRRKAGREVGRCLRTSVEHVIYECEHMLAQFDCKQQLPVGVENFDQPGDQLRPVFAADVLVHRKQFHAGMEFEAELDRDEERPVVEPDLRGQVGRNEVDGSRNQRKLVVPAADEVLRSVRVLKNAKHPVDGKRLRRRRKDRVCPFGEMGQRQADSVAQPVNFIPVPQLRHHMPPALDKIA